MNDLGKFKRYRIGEAAKALGVKTSVLRFWEGEFPALEPVRTASGQRLYTEEHLALLRRIKALLYDEGLTIEGARRRLEEGDAAFFPHSSSDRASASGSGPGPDAAHDPARDSGRSASDASATLLREVAVELRSLLALLRDSPRG